VKAQKKLLGSLLLKKSSRSRLWIGWLSLCAGTTLLLLSVIIWWNFQELLYNRSDNDSLGSSFLTIGKKVTDESMGRSSLSVFSETEIMNLRKAPGVTDVGVLTSNHFPASISLNSRLGFSSIIFLESVPDQFIDKKPQAWTWISGSKEVPIILSGEFLNLYNYGFALSQGLPQLSETSIQALSFDLVLGSPAESETYTAHVAGFSDRITSVLVPQSFMEFANDRYGKGQPVFPLRLIAKVSDPSDKGFVEYLRQKNYVTNAEQLRWNKVRAVVQVIAGSTGVLAILLMGISALVFILFIELTIAKAQQSLILLLELGYNPQYLRKFMLQRFIPLMVSAIAVACVIAIVAQVLASTYIRSMSLGLPLLPGWPVWLAAIISLALLTVQVKWSIGKALKKI
jgi:hypothetical protein